MVFCAQHRSSRSQMFFKIAVLKIFAIFTGKHLCWSLFLIKLQPWRPTTLLLIDSNTGVFLPILQIFYMEHLWWLLVKVAVMKNSCSEKQLFRKKLFRKIASLIDNLKVLHWKGTVPLNNYSGTNGKNLWGMLLGSFILGRVAKKQPPKVFQEKRCS